MSQTTVTVQQARDNFSELIERVALAKESFLVTKFGKPKAAIVAADELKGATKQAQMQKQEQALEAIFGMWADRKDMKDSAKWVAGLRRREAFRLYDKKD